MSKIDVKEPEKIDKKDKNIKRILCSPTEMDCKIKCGNKFKSKEKGNETIIKINKDKKFNKDKWKKIEGEKDKDYRWYKDWFGGFIGFGEGRCDVLSPLQEELPIPEEGCNEEYPWRTNIEEDNGLFCYEKKKCSENSGLVKKNGEKVDCKRILRPKYKLINENTECITKKGEEVLGEFETVDECALECYKIENKVVNILLMTVKLKSVYLKKNHHQMNV